MSEHADEAERFVFAFVYAQLRQLAGRNQFILSVSSPTPRRTTVAHWVHLCYSILREKCKLIRCCCFRGHLSGGIGRGRRFEVLLLQDQEGLDGILQPLTYCRPSLYSSSSFCSNILSASNSRYFLNRFKAERASSIESCVSVCMFSCRTNQERNLKDKRRCRDFMK